MEIVTGIKIRDILLDNQNWFKLFLKYPKLIRRTIIINGLKTIVCCTSFLDYHQCPTCNKFIKVSSCKLRFCPSWGKKAPANWIKTSINTFPKTTYQHITFAISHKLWNFFWKNRYLLNKVSALAVFGWDFKGNTPLHLSTTIGGSSLSHNFRIKGSYFYYDTLKEMWKYVIISLLQNKSKIGRLKLPLYLRYIKIASCFCSWMIPIFHKKRYISDAYRYYDFLSKRTRNKPLPIIYNLLKKKKHLFNKVLTPYRSMILNSFKLDSLCCSICNLL